MFVRTHRIPVRASTVGGYRLEADFGGGTKSVINWNPNPPCRLTPNWLLPVTTTVIAQQVLLRLLPSTHPSGIKLNHVTWENPVALNFHDGGRVLGPCGRLEFLLVESAWAPEQEL